MIFNGFRWLGDVFDFTWKQSLRLLLSFQPFRFSYDIRQHLIEFTIRLKLI